jgi:hypothetical protein
MRSVLLLLVVLLSAGCAAKQDTASSQNSSAPVNFAAAKSEKSAESKAATSDANARPVEFTFLGITPDKENISYRIKVNTDKPIDEVDLSLKETDAGGRSPATEAARRKLIAPEPERSAEADGRYEHQQTRVDRRAGHRWLDSADCGDCRRLERHEFIDRCVPMQKLAWRRWVCATCRNRSGTLAWSS